MAREDHADRSAATWLPSALDAIEAAVRGPHPPLVVLDFDGTLAPIAPRPELAEMSASMRDALAALAARAPVAILSGRGIDDVAAKVDLDRAVYAGCHGLEVRGPALTYRHPEAARHQAALDAAAEALRGALAPVRGALVEHKGLAIAVHRRLVDPARHPEIAALVARVAAMHPTLARKAGKMVDELVPDVAWDKGQALRMMMRVLGEDRAVIFVGDDRTDEDAFTALGGEGVSVLVAATPRPTAARYQLDDVDAVERFLRRLTASL